LIKERIKKDFKFFRKLNAFSKTDITKSLTQAEIYKNKAAYPFGQGLYGGR